MTQTTTHKRLPVDLTEVEGNAHHIISALRKAARRAGWTTDEIDEMTRRLTVGDFDNLVRVAMGYCE